MKTIKIILVTLLVIALGVGLFFLISKDGIDTGVPPDGPKIPEECNLEWAEHYIDSVYRAIPNGEFKQLETRRHQMQNHFDKLTQGYPAQCGETIVLMLRNRYTVRFVAMTKSEFADARWPHFVDIRRMNNDLMKEVTQANVELKTIESTCSEYGEVLAYNRKVKDQQGQRPSSIRTRWDDINSKILIDIPPSASAPVTHTTAYDASRPGEVKSALYKGNVSFLEALVQMAFSEIKSDPTRLHYNQVCNTVSEEIERFEKYSYSLYGIDGSQKARGLHESLDEFERFVNNND